MPMKPGILLQNIFSLYPRNVVCASDKPDLSTDPQKCLKFQLKKDLQKWIEHM